MVTNAFLSIMQKGGYPFMVPLLALSIISLAVILERCFVLWRKTLLSEQAMARLRTFAAKKDNEGLDKLLSGDSSVSAGVLSDAIHSFDEAKGKISLEKALENSADKNIDRLNDRFWMLRAISHVAPVIGLLGTVVGLAISFNNIGSIGLNQQTVASGIAMALITTVAGLTIALPTIVAEYTLKAWAESRFRAIRGLLHDFVIWYGLDS
jgi:biopolymer transport protein ExbB